ncbi:MAG: RagB/SusD family nutrient uptake outer membrane protein [Muribaculaceae bacterium]|nr:RagB/SusD family nutrient uptake outer membrane protein [Muribaculaceae bacterium]
MKYNKILTAIASVMLLSACSLDKSPEGVLSTADPFKTTGEIQNYVNQFYETAPRAQGLDVGGGQYICGYDTYSDNLAANSVVTRLDGALSVGSASKLTNYTYIRNVNFLICNLGNCPEQQSPDFKQLAGEAYYFRAWYYYGLLVNYGPVSIVEKPLNPDAEEMQAYSKRNSRTEVADFIINDLKTAVANLQEKNNSATMRIHRDVARALLSEVALFEGTWEKYHKGTKFADPACTDAKVKEYLQTAADAAKAVIDRGVWKIYSTGDALNDYRVLFATTDLGSNSEVLWYKKYDGDLVGNNVDRYLNTGGGGIGVTSSLVDDYLTIDGRPFVGTERLNAKKVYGEELKPTVRDPRLCQTVAMPGQKLRPDQPAFQFPPLVGTGSAYGQNVTGYSLLKHNQIDYTGNLDAEYKGATPAIQCRYADVLLNYAEALAELDGSANASKIIDALKPLRDRVGMPAMDFDREYNTDAAYPQRDLDKYIQAVRRERRVEKACEGLRFQDILRWAAAGKLINGWWPQGALFKGSDLEKHDFGTPLIPGENIFLDENGFILPINPSGHTGGYKFNVERDYLLPIQERMLTLTNHGWEQNPGW